MCFAPTLSVMRPTFKRTLYAVSMLPYKDYIWQTQQKFMLIGQEVSTGRRHKNHKFSWESEFVLHTLLRAAAPVHGNLSVY
jgi:hypothetical protein